MIRSLLLLLFRFRVLDAFISGFSLHTSSLLDSYILTLLFFILEKWTDFFVSSFLSSSISGSLALTSLLLSIVPFSSVMKSGVLSNVFDEECLPNLNGFFIFSAIIFFKEDFCGVLVRLKTLVFGVKSLMTEIASLFLSSSDDGITTKWS